MSIAAHTIQPPLPATQEGPQTLKQTGQTSPTGPRVGVGVVIVRDGLVLLGKRKGSHGAGTWALPGGHLEFGESVEECARREVLEETGLEIESLTQGAYSNDLIEGKHYVTLFVVAHCGAGEPRLLEPEKCSQWQWFRWAEMPEPLFKPLATVRDAGYVPQSHAGPQPAFRPSPT